jgi:hypothetical protein
VFLTGETSIIAGVGGFVGMAGALGYGFKLLVDVVGKQLKVQNGMIEDLHHGIKYDLESHIQSCKVCQSNAVINAATAVTAAAEAAAKAVVIAASAEREIVAEGRKLEKTKNG